MGVDLAKIIEKACDEATAAELALWVAKLRDLVIATMARGIKTGGLSASIEAIAEDMAKRCHELHTQHERPSDYKDERGKGPRY